ncbi:hypothetical protein HZB02_04850 [Candidatus Woesearchaeota archaeon]|nr:hypothetical protein [Candidatus Woesearchaeota archaeon]
MRRMLVLAVVISLLLITGCIGSRRSDSPSSVNDYHTGTKALEMKFLQNNPPSILYDVERLSVSLEMFNHGTYDIGNANARLDISGFDPNIIFFPQVLVFPELKGKSTYNPDGDYSIVEYTGSISLPPEADHYDTPLIVTACYNYETDASIPVCIDPGIYSVDTGIDRACTVGRASGGSGQGAPVAVQGIDVQMTSAGGEMMQGLLRIDISNNGGGKVIDPQYIGPAFCPHNLRNANYLNRVQIVYVRLPGGGDITGSCHPLDDFGSVLLRNDKATITCKTQPFARQTPPFKTALEIKLRYGYMDSIRKDIRIKRTP